jgi:heterodisulfide reductase subunit A
MPKNTSTGLFLCRCGTNIANFVDLDAVKVWAEARPEIGLVEIHDLLCSPAGKEFVTKTISANKVDTVVVAACSPKMHEATFQKAGEEAGANMAQVSMANIREQCGWVTPDKQKATAKAISLVNAAIKRSSFNKELFQTSMEVNTDLVIIGGGIAGIEAALLAAQAGRKVTIIEKEISLGGSIIKTEEVAPAMECAPCVLAPRLSAVNDNPNITVVSNAEVTEVMGFFGNFIVKARKKARYVQSSCIGCEACFEVCPVDVASVFKAGLGMRKAIYTAFPGSVPAAAIIDREHCRHFVDNSCSACVDVCPFTSIDFNDKDEMVEIKAGAVIVATGAGDVDPAALKNYGFGTIDNVYTMPQFERIASSNGPYNSEIQLKNGTKPAVVAIIHCAGSLCKEGLDYCSGICCMNAVKAGELLRKKIPDVKVYNIHDRLVFTNPEMETFYHHQQKAGTRFIRANDLSAVKVASGNGPIEVTINNEKLSVDMVILSTGMAPMSNARAFASLLDIELDKSGFFKSDHSILHATGATLDGIYLAGACSSPCTVPTAITRSQAAAGDAIAKLVPGKKIELETLTAIIDEKLCGGCKLCISVCPYKAITFNTDKKVSVVNEAICRGCGTCAATCPGGASSAKHFTNEQIYAEIGGLLHG